MGDLGASSTVPDRESKAMGEEWQLAIFQYADSTRGPHPRRLLASLVERGVAIKWKIRDRIARLVLVLVGQLSTYAACSGHLTILAAVVVEGTQPSTVALGDGIAEWKTKTSVHICGWLLSG